MNAPLIALTGEAWLEWRRGGIGGSDIGALLGLSKYATPTSLYYDKLGLLDHRDDTPRLRIGRRMETVLGEEFHDRTGLYCVGEQTLWAHPEHPFARCTLDGFVTESQDRDDLHDKAVLGTVQFKTDGRFGWDEIPPAIRAQCVWEMGVTGKRHSWLVVMFAGFRVEIFEIPMDADARSDWEFMIGTAEAFWKGCIEQEIPPPPDGEQITTDTITKVHHPDPGSVLKANHEALDLVEAIRDATANTKAAEAYEGALRNELRDLLGDRTELLDGDLLIASWRPQVARRVDLARMRREVPAIVERFTNENESRVLRLHEPKGATNAGSR